MFYVNRELIDRAHSTLFERNNLYWVIGGACTGKSAVCRAIAESKGIALHDMDEHIFGHFMGRYSPERHPANKTWFSADNPLAWALSLSKNDFDALNRAANAEYLDLLAEDLKDHHQPLLIDGGITHPSILAQVIPPTNIFCLELPDGEAESMWEHSPARAEMKSWIQALPNPEQMWRKFLSFDRLISQTIGRECRETRIQTYLRDQRTSVEALAEVVAAHFGI